MPDPKGASGLKCNKFYIIATAASGKSTFAAKHPTYNGYQIVDFEEHLPPLSLWTRLILYASRVIKPLRKLIRNSPDMIARRKGNYFSHVCEYMMNCDNPIAVLGRTPPSDFLEKPIHDSIRFSMVLISEEDHRRNCASRGRDLRNPIPFFDHWTTDFEKILLIREESADFAARHRLTVYDSLSGAIDTMHEQLQN